MNQKDEVTVQSRTLHWLQSPYLLCIPREHDSGVRGVFAAQNMKTEVVKNDEDRGTKIDTGLG